jgi:hypothetical protein
VLRHHRYGPGHQTLEGFDLALAPAPCLIGTAQLNRVHPADEMGLSAASNSSPRTAAGRV